MREETYHDDGDPLSYDIDHIEEWRSSLAERGFEDHEIYLDHKRTPDEKVWEGRKVNELNDEDRDDFDKECLDPSIEMSDWE